MRDGDGHASAALTRLLTCTGEPLPGAPPRLDEVTLNERDVVAGWSTHGRARMSGTHPPLQLIARSATPGYGWSGTPVEGSPADTSFSMACREELGMHEVTWELTARDSLGRESEVVTRTVHCGVCR